MVSQGPVNIKHPSILPCCRAVRQTIPFQIEIIPSYVISMLFNGGGIYLGSYHLVIKIDRGSFKFWIHLQMNVPTIDVHLYHRAYFTIAF